MARPGPLEAVRRRLESSLGPSQLTRLPRRYFRVGDVLVLDLPLPGDERAIAEAYARVIGSRSVLGRTGAIAGELRLPSMRLLWGDSDTETHHQENGVRYRLDPARIMWSPGNLPERQRAASWDCRGETVVDLFAGVGYFALPIALSTGAARVVAIEKNAESHRYLLENAALNGVQDRFEARLGDCRDVAPWGTADRVVLGYLPDAAEFVPTAVRTLRPEGGRLHVHRVVPAGAPRDRVFEDVRAHAERAGLRARLEHLERVKSFAARLDHVVLDVRVEP